MITMLFTLLAATALATNATPPQDTALKAMQELPALEGKWAGKGWIRMGPGEPTPFIGEETVELRLDGRVMIIEGRHLTPDSSKVVHHALAFVSWDEATKEYRFQSYVTNRGGGDHRGYMQDGAFVWENQTPGGTVRFIITVKDDTWHEVGQMQRGDKWYPMFEMTLKRVK